MKEVFLCLLIIATFQSRSQNLVPHWKFQTGETVQASPISDKTAVYVGSENGNFYAIDLETGKERWRFESGRSIQAPAVLIGETVFFEAGNVFYSLNKSTGKEVWSQDPKLKYRGFEFEGKKYNYKIDRYDFKRSVPIVHQGVIYIGTGGGKLYGLNAKNGKIILEIESDGFSPIRSSPMIDSGKLFFGDWEGMIYCYDLDKEDFTWKKKTYRYKKPYGTFGGVVSEFALFNGLLYFGARNQTLNVLSVGTGEKVWTFTDPGMGWIVGDPVIYNDTLYIGGSDNYTMYAFEPNLGHTHWVAKRNKNINTKPVVTERWVIYSSGNGSDVDDKGEVVMVDRSSGNFIARYETPKGLFSSPFLVEDRLVFGSHDGNVYCLAVENE